MKVIKVVIIFLWVMEDMVKVKAKNFTELLKRISETMMATFMIMMDMKVRIAKR